MDMAAKRRDSEQGPASSLGPEADQRLSAELLMGQLVEQAVVDHDSSGTAAAAADRESP
jgi:hypothetical protein